MAEQKQDLFRELEEAKKEGANILLPSTAIVGLSAGHSLVIESVFLSTNISDGDVYPHDSYEDNDRRKKYRITKQGLVKLSNCAAVIWPPSQNYCVKLERDYAAYQAVGGIRKADGSPYFLKRMYDIDLTTIEEDIHDNYLKKIPTWEGWGTRSAKDIEAKANELTRRDMIQKRKHKLKLAETGAMDRVIRDLLGLKNAYTIEELKKRFVVVRIVFIPDYSNKQVQARLMEAHIRAITGVYGENAPLPAEPIDVTPSPAAIEGPSSDGAPKGEPHPEPKTPTPPADPPTNPVESQVIDFTLCDEESQIKTLGSLAKMKGYDIPAYLTRSKRKSITELNPDKRVEFFRYLLSLPDDDVPFA